jgi:hypothetical protein
MTDRTRTAEAHRHIEQIAAVMLDTVAAHDLRPLLERLDRLQREGNAIVDAAAPMLTAITGDPTELRVYECASRSALMAAASFFALCGKGKPPLQRCPHIDANAPPSEVTIIMVALRRWTCRPCWHPTAADRARLDADHSCDVCLADSELLTPITTAFAGALVSLHVGRCCLEFFDYNEPVATISYERAPRNAPCPCGSGRKVKHCHGRSRP